MPDRSIIPAFLKGHYDMNRLPAEAVPEVAKLLERLTAQLHEIEARNSARKANNQAQKKSRKKRHSLTNTLAHHLQNGMSTESAIHAVAVASGSNEDAIRAMLPKAGQIELRQQRQIRNREIMQRVAKGWTNAEIGRRYGVHEKHIARIIAKIRSNAPGGE